MYQLPQPSQAAIDADARLRVCKRVRLTSGEFTDGIQWVFTEADGIGHFWSSGHRDDDIGALLANDVIDMASTTTSSTFFAWLRIAVLI